MRGPRADAAAFLRTGRRVLRAFAATLTVDRFLAGRAFAYAYRQLPALFAVPGRDDLMELCRDRIRRFVTEWELVEQWLKKHRPWFDKRALAMADGDYGRAQDAVEHVLRKLWGDPWTISRKKYPIYWAWSVIRHDLVDEARRNTHRKQKNDELRYVLPEYSVSREENILTMLALGLQGTTGLTFQEKLIAVVNLLPKGRTRAVMRQWAFGHDDNQIAKLSSLKEVTVRVHKHSGFRKLLAMIEETNGGQE